ncbi:hypothetical protein HWV62_32413 [Athelia sp. TMB]|nr:hypothetical protein HWV62_32413 [Athelia sp. TMB]
MQTIIGEEARTIGKVAKLKGRGVKILWRHPRGAPRFSSSPPVRGDSFDNAVSYANDDGNARTSIDYPGSALSHKNGRPSSASTAATTPRVRLGAADAERREEDVREDVPPRITTSPRSSATVNLESPRTSLRSEYTLTPTTFQVPQRRTRLRCAADSGDHADVLVAPTPSDWEPETYVWLKRAGTGLGAGGTDEGAGQG